MSENWEKGQKQVELPNPELNPLQNPTLGRNLGRWAQVYFTAPPERREQAVVDLLRELKSETDPEPPRIDRATPITRPPVPKVICETCQQPNELDHKVCGLCGSPLQGSHSASATSTASTRSAGFRVNPEPPASTVYEPPSAVYEEDDSLQWLREKSLTRLSDPDESSAKWKYGLAALAMLLGTFGVLQWVSSRPTSSQPPVATSSAPASSAPASPQTGEGPAPVAAEPAAPAPASPAPSTHVAHMENSRSPVPTKYPPRELAVARSNAAPPTVAPVEGGAQELALARGYLEGKHGRRDSTEAAKWLWKAVAKQNSTADVLLADLYRTGDGVSKNCDQARLLLVAATQKGAPTAADKLRNLETAGCR